MSLQDCLRKAGKAFNASDATVINENVEQLVSSGVERATAETQAVEQFLSQQTDELNDIATQAEELGATVAREDLTQPDYLADFTATSATDFHGRLSEAMSASTNALSVKIYDVSEYENMQLFLTDDGKAGFALEYDGGLISVFKHPDSSIDAALDVIVPAAIQAGATKLEAFDGFLTARYKEFGFVEVLRDDWNDNYAPAGWDKSVLGTPAVVAMELKGVAQYEYNEETIPFSVQHPVGVRRGDESLQPSDATPDQRRTTGRESDGSLNGLPREVGNFNAAASSKIAAVAENYVTQLGLEYSPPTNYATVDVERARRIAEAYEAMKHDPENPEVKEAYAALTEEVIAQYQAALDAGLKVEFINFERDGDPYAASPRMVTDDINNNNHMWVFSTRDGFGSSVEIDVSNNPLLAETDFVISGQKALVNDLFRVVHDYFGHAKEGVGFRAIGEENAWRIHSAMFSPLARQALTTETRGQNSWVNYGPHGEANQTATSDTVFADQKTGLLPQWVVDEGRIDQPIFNQDINPTAVRNALGLHSAVEQAVMDTDLQQWSKKAGNNNKQVKALDIKIAELQTTYKAEQAEFEAAMDRLEANPGNQEAIDNLEDKLSDTTVSNEISKLKFERSRIANNPLAPGVEIWSKISKTAGVKKEELTWLGLEEFLKVDPKGKFSRETVLNFVRANGVVVEETIGDQETSSRNELEWDSGTVWDEEEAYMHNVEDMMYEFDAGDDDTSYINIATFMDKWMHDNIDTVLANYKTSLPEGEFAELTELDTPGDQIVWLANHYPVNEDMRSEAREDFEEAATAAAREAYLDDPTYIHKATNVEDLYIFGSDDLGYDIRHGGWDNAKYMIDNQLHIDSLNETQIHAFHYAIEEGLLEQVEDVNVAKWGDYVMDGSWDNYREIKLILPDLGGQDFDYDMHFEDSNIVAFLRVDDRDLSTGTTREQKRTVEKEDFNEFDDPSRPRYGVKVTVDGKVYRSDYDTAEERDANFIPLSDAGGNQVDNVAKTFFIDEFQSDWHQQGRQEGYKFTESDRVEARAKAEVLKKEQQDNLDSLEEKYGEDWKWMSSHEERNVNVELGDKIRKLHEQADAVPNAPFKGDAWVNLGLKRAIIEAVDNGYESIAWPNSQVLVDRWSEMYRELYVNQYDRKMVKGIKKLTGQTPVQLDLEGNPYPTTSDVLNAFDLVPSSESGRFNLKLKSGHNTIEAIPVNDEGIASTGRSLGEVSKLTFSNEGHAVEFLKDVVKTESTQGYFIIPITDELRADIKNDGLTLFQKQSGEARGYYDPTNVLIRLNEAANPSTFIHEFAHFMYDMEQKLKGPNLNAINNWYHGNAEDIAAEASEHYGHLISGFEVDQYLDNGTTGDVEIDTAILVATHEQFARGFESYVMEGKAPSMELRNVFRVLARMLTAVYKAITGGLSTPNVTDDMRQVFDRLIATEEQIAASEARDRAAPLFTDAAMAGMTEEQFQKYQEQARKATDKSNETLRDKVMKELTRVQQKWWGDERDDIIDEQEEILRTEPVYVARARLRSGDDLKLDYVSTIEIMGVKNLMGIVPMRGLTAKGGLGTHPDEAAKVYGFETGDQLIEALMTEPKLQDKAEANADAEMIERHGDIMNDGTLEKLADDMVRNEQRGTLLLTEIKALSKGQNVPLIDKQTIKALAAENIGKLALKDIRPDRYRKAEIHSAQEAAIALSKGDQVAALRAKTQQVMNFYLWREARDAQLTGGKVATYMARFKKKSLRERIGKAGNNYLENIDRILERFEFRKSVSFKKHAEARDSLQAWVDQQGSESDMIALSTEVLDETYARHWREIPIDELVGIQESIQSIENSAKALNNIIINEEKLTYEQTITRMLNQMGQLKDKVFPQYKDSVDNGGVRRWTENFLTEQVKIPWMMRWLDNGEEVGIMHQTIMQPMNNAYDAEVRMWDRVGKVVMQAINGRSKDDVKRHQQEISIPEIANTETKLEGKLLGHQIIAVALNTGNEGNLRKMLLGEGWATTDEEVSIENPKLQAVLQHMSTSDWDLVELIWEQIGSLKADLAAIHKRATGITMDEVKPVSFVQDGRTIKGGYYPVKYDANRSEKARLNEEKADEQAVSMLTAGGFVQPVARTGARINRTEFVGPIKFSLDVVPNHIQEVIHFITHYDAIKQVNKLTGDPRIAAAIKTKLGPAQYALLKPWLNDVAKDGKEAPIKSGLESLARRLRFGTTYGVMGFKASTGLIQIAGIFNTAAEVGVVRTLRAVRTVLGSEKSIRETWEFAKANSKVLEHRQQTMDREIKNALISLQSKRGPLAVVQEAAMMHIALVQTYTVDLPSWYAAYAKGMDKFEGDEQRAFQYADWVVENVQGSGLTKDMSSIMRSKSELYRLGTMFMTFFSSLYNHNADVKRAVQAGQLSIPAAVGKLMLLWTLPALFETVMREGWGDEDDEESLLERTLVGTAMMPITTVPFFNQVANGVISGYGYSASPVFPLVEGGVEATRALAEGGELTKYKIKQASKAVGIAFAIPGVNQAWITGEHLYDYAVEGEDLSMRYLLVTTNKDK